MVQKYLDILLHKMEVSIRLRNFSTKQANSQRLGVTLLWEMFTSQKRDKTQSCYHALLPLTHILITRGTSCISFERQIKTNSQSCKGKESILCFYLQAVIGSASVLNMIFLLWNREVFTCVNVCECDHFSYQKLGQISKKFYIQALSWAQISVVFVCGKNLLIRSKMGFHFKSSIRFQTNIKIKIVSWFFELVLLLDVHLNFTK